MSASPSRIALANAYLRAAHQLLEPRPRLLEDPLAVPLLGPAAPEQIQHAASRYRSAEALALRSHVMLRTRYAEDRLAAAVDRGVQQYLLLGAGLETFAYRQPAWASGLAIVEVDTSVMQQVKRSMLSSIGKHEPSNLRPVQIDVARESLLEGLQQQGVPRDVPTLVSWLGLSMYLPEARVDDLLRTVADFPAGSELVMTFAWPLGAEDANGGGAPASTPAARSARAGEPWITFFMPPALEQKLTAFGFTQIQFLTPAEASRQYFDGRTGELPAPRTSTIVSAIR